jgi:hypothetical protein
MKWQLVIVAMVSLGLGMTAAPPQQIAASPEPANNRLAQMTDVLAEMDSRLTEVDHLVATTQQLRFQDSIDVQPVQVTCQLQDCPDGQCPARPVANAVINTVTGAVRAVQSVAPPYPRLQQNYGSAGYSTTVTSSQSYGSNGGGYSSSVYSSETYGSGGYSSVRHRGQPVRGFLRRVIGR